MSDTFMTAPSLLFSSESVTEGHPDKICDQISDAVLDWSLTQTPTARVACESGIKSDEADDWVSVFGEVTPLPPKHVVRDLVRKTLNDIGYTDRSHGTSGHTVHIEVHLSGQSADIALGVDHGLEGKQGTLEDDLDTGAGDQGMMFGYACDETESLLPLPIYLAHRLAERLTEVRKAGVVPYLRPDGKTQVTFDYEDGKPVRLASVLISTQHQEGIDRDTVIRPDLIEQVIRPTIPAQFADDDFSVYINPTGTFVLGGPHADTGLTGRKIIVDTYGGMGRHGGGAFSGKDPTKVDRSAAYAARWVAKHVVAAGAAKRCEVQVAYAIGVARPVSLLVETFGTETVDKARIEGVIPELFDLRPAAILRDLDLRRPIYRKTAAYGHFGRSAKEFTWEATPRLDDLKSALSL